MSARKSERLMNLLITLLVSRGYVTKQRLREVIPDYKDAASEDAFERMFDRDKDDLRALGVPIEVGGHDPLFDDEQGYRIVRSAFELPEISFEADEAAVIGLAARVWQQAGLASATSDALLKLKAAGVEVDREALNVAQPRLAPDDPSFERFWEAVSTRRTARFRYRGSASAEPSERELQPWGIVSYRSRWYVVGHDLLRDDQRMFRLSRVIGDVDLVGEEGSFTVPEGTDIRQLASRLAPDTTERVAVVDVRTGKAHALRHRAGTPSPPPSPGAAPSQAESSAGAAATPLPEAPDGWDRLEIGFGRLDQLVDELLGYGPDVVVRAPDDLRSAVVDRLRAAAGAA